MFRKGAKCVIHNSVSTSFILIADAVLVGGWVTLVMLVLVGGRVTLVMHYIEFTFLCPAHSYLNTLHSVVRTSCKFMNT